MHDAYRELALIGKGSYGKVYKARGAGPARRAGWGVGRSAGGGWGHTPARRSELPPFRWSLSQPGPPVLRRSRAGATTRCWSSRRCLSMARRRCVGLLLCVCAPHLAPCGSRASRCHGVPCVVVGSHGGGVGAPVKKAIPCRWQFHLSASSCGFWNRNWDQHAARHGLAGGAHAHTRGHRGHVRMIGPGVGPMIIAKVVRGVLGGGGQVEK